MNKKFLSAVLFGALMVTSTGTFVSCKDYDDDIEGINKELSDLKSAISALQAKVDGGKYVTNIVKNGEGITITWNDNSTSTIETIKGDKGQDGKNGTVVTIVDGFWAFDGVKSEYPAKGDKGDKGETGAAGANGAASAGHDAQIKDGYWMVWDAAKGEYVQTEYIAGGVAAVAVKGGYNLTVRDANGDEQTIFIPTSSTMGYMDVLASDAWWSDNSNMHAIYGINAKEVVYGPYKKTLQKGLYVTLDRDLKVVVNPQGTDASAYAYSLMNSANVSTGLKFKEAVPFEGVLTRATSENAVWVLPHDFTRYEDINDARTRNYLLFKANDGAKHALSLTATLNETTIKTPYDLGAMLKKMENVKVYPENINTCLLNKEYAPISWTSDSHYANAVYDYWITLEQSPKNLKDAILYGVEIVNEGHAFRFTKETGVRNHIKLVYNYILMDGTVVEGDKAPIFYAWMEEEMATAHAITLDRLETPFDATVILDKDKNYTDEYVMSTKPYSLASLLSDMSDVEKAVWKSAIASGTYSWSLIGGENEGADWNTWSENIRRQRAIRPIFDTKKNEVVFNFHVSSEWPANLKLNKAYELTVTVNDEDTNSPVASIVLPFELTQPTLDITRVNGEKAIWNKDVLSIYGDKVIETYDGTEVVSMHVPFYEAFKTAYAKEYSVFAPGARYYTLSCGVEDDDMMLNYWGYTVLGKNFTTLANAPLTSIVYSGKAAEWNTSTQNTIGAGIPIKANYTFYGVYPATKEQVSNFTLRFASLLGDAKKVEAKKEFTSNNVTREVVLTDADFTLVDALGDNFYLFNGVKADGNIDKRSDMNLRQGFEEGTEGFDTNFTLATTDIKAYYYKNGKKVNLNIAEGAATLKENTNTKTRAWEPGAADATKVLVTNLDAKEAVKDKGYAAIPGGIMIQLPSSVGTTEPVTIEFALVDVFNVSKTLKVVVKAAK